VTAGLDAEDFARSHKLEVTRWLAVHDASIWGASHRLEGRSTEDVKRILESDEWFRLTVVREPSRRLWSAWATKVLVRDPRFVAEFGEDWFPPVPSSATDVVDSFRRFVCTLPTRAAEWHNAHWSPQADLIGLPNVAYGHVGRVEQLERTAAVLNEYVVSRGGRFPALGLENPSFLPFAPGLFDSATLAACNLWTARDYEAFGYEPLSTAVDAPDDTWYATVDANIAAIQAVIERNERIADLWRMLEDRDPARRGLRLPRLGRIRSALGRTVRRFLPGGAVHGR
jgi:hypothetical protein